MKLAKTKRGLISKHGAPLLWGEEGNLSTVLTSMTDPQLAYFDNISSRGAKTPELYNTMLIVCTILLHELGEDAETTQEELGDYCEDFLRAVRIEVGIRKKKIEIVSGERLLKDNTSARYLLHSAHL